MTWHLRPVCTVVVLLSILTATLGVGCLDTLIPEVPGAPPGGNPVDDDPADDDSDGPPPPPPPPPPPGDYAAGGYIFRDGFWSGWRADEERNFVEIGDYGGMRRNASAIRYIGVDADGAGGFGFRVRFTHLDQFREGGGTHLAGIASNPLAFRPEDEYGQRYPVETTRVDLDRPRDGRVRAVVFVVLGEVRYEETAWYDVPFGIGEWAGLDLRWRHSGSDLIVTVNGQSHTFQLLPGSPRLGSYLYFGNMDSITGYIEFDDIWFEQ